MNNNRFNSLNMFFKEQFGEKIYKVSLDASFTCPNRDGKISYRGCIFCSDQGSGEFAGDRQKTIYEQIEDQLELIKNKFPNGKVIAYFQNFTNTYGDIKYLKKVYDEALSHPNVIGLAIATRPDCLSDEVLELLSDYNKKTFLWIELGLQTLNDEVAVFINRGYETSLYKEKAIKLNELEIKFVTHIIIGLPKEKEDDALNTAILASELGTWGIKIHLLHIIKDTYLEQLFNKNEFKSLSKDEFIKKVLTILSNIPYNIVIHRLTGDGEKETLIEPRWSLNKRDVLNSIQKALKKDDIVQGMKWREYGSYSQIENNKR